MRRYKNSYSFHAFILWMSYLVARNKVTRMNACFHFMAKTALPFGGSVVCSSNRCTVWETIYYQVMLHVWNSVEACHHCCPVSSSGEPIWDLWWTEWYWYLSSPSTSVSYYNYHSTNAPYSSFHSYTIGDVYELNIWQHQEIKLFPCCNRCCQ